MGNQGIENQFFVDLGKLALSVMFEKFCKENPIVCIDYFLHQTIMLLIRNRTFGETNFLDYAVRAIVTENFQWKGY